MKISYSDDEIIVDLTNTNIKNDAGDNDIVLLKTNYLVPILKGVTKSYFYYNRNKVNAHYLNCTCKEYRENIKLYPLRDIRRICKHIYFIITKDYQSRIDELTSLLLAHRFWDKIQEVYQVKYQTEFIYISFEKDLKFIRIYRKFSEWKYYTYVIENRSWINNLPPFKSYAQNKIITEYFIDLLNQFTNPKSLKRITKKTA